MDLESAEIERMAREGGVRDLVSRYCDALARGDREAWAATWADDGEWELLGERTRGRDRIVARWDELIAGLSFIVQLAHTGLIEIDGDAGTGRWSITEQGQLGNGKGMLNIGIYDDEYVRRNGTWYFARRRFSALYMGPPDLSGKAAPYRAQDRDERGRSA